MTAVDRYISNVMANVFAAPAERERFEADLRAHIAEAGGEAPSQIIDSMGLPEDVAAAFNADREIRYAGFWARCVAFLGDCAFMMALALPPASLLLLADGRLISLDHPSPATAVALVLTAVALGGAFLLYFPLLEARFGKTLGKHLLRLRVVRETGAPITLGQAFVRRLSFYFEMLVVDALFIPFTDKKQRALDIVAKTVVAKEPGEETPWWGWATCLAMPFIVLLLVAAVIALCAPA